ncbi:MAG: alpha,alpha-trehalose-phosphate synthase (UDP-forming) [Candidatus Limnocylindrales bacterium]
MTIGQTVISPAGRGANTGQSQEGTRGSALRDHLGRLLEPGQRLVVVSNRGPLTFRRSRGDEWRVTRGSGGLVTALGEAGRHAPVTWVSAAMDAGDHAARLALEEDQGSSRTLTEAIGRELPDQDLRLRLVEMPEDAFRAHYSVVANPFLWFLQHQLYQLPYQPRVDDDLIEAWRGGYRVVNQRLGRVAVEAAGDVGRPVVLLQDYHLYLAAQAVREARPDALVTHFNHIPWPGVDAWQVLPQQMRRSICEGLLANDILGFQTDRYATNFLLTADAFVRDARVDPNGRNVRWRGRTIWVRSYPISLDPKALTAFAAGAAVRTQRANLKARLERAGQPRLIVRVDRLEPSKNALRGFLAFEAMLKREPELRRSVRFLAVQSVSRERLPEYALYASEVREVIARVNGMADPDEQPIWLLDGSDRALAIAALSMADVVLVNPIIDGMNLVAKEAVLVGAPVLVLSETAGAAEQLAADSLMVTAADVAGTSRTLRDALAMPAETRMVHLRRLRASVRSEDLGWWLARQMRDLVAVAEGGRPPSRQLRDTTRRFEPLLLG